MGYVGTLGAPIGAYRVVAANLLQNGDVFGSGQMSLTLATSLLNAAGYTFSTTTTEGAFIVSNAGGIGSSLHPVNISMPSARVFVGANNVAGYVTGAALGNTIHCYPPKLASVLYFNGAAISCQGSSSGVALPANIFFVAGVTTSQSSLAEDMYFLPDFVTQEVVDRSIPVYANP